MTDTLTIPEFIRRLYEDASERLIGLCALMLTTTALEGLALGLLVPVLELADGKAGTGRSWGALAAAFRGVGLPLTFGTALLAVVAIFVLQSGLSRWRESVIAATLADFQHRRRQRLYRALFGADWLFLQRQRKGELLATFTLEVERSGRSLHRATQLVVGLMTAAIYTAMALVISWQFTIVMMLAAAVLMTSIRRTVGDTGDVGRETTVANANYHALLAEHLDAAKLIKGSGMEAHTAPLADSRGRNVVLVEERALKHAAKLRAYLQPAAVALLCGGIWVAIRVLGMGLAAVTVVLFVFFRLFPVLALIQQHFFELRLVIPAFARVEFLLQEAARAAEPRGGTLAPPATLASTRLDDAWFAYESDRFVIRGITIELPAGETVAVVGSSGAGKSTAVDLILGLVRPQRGAVLVDGRSLDAYDVAAWRRQVGYVTQETILLNDSVRANIAWGAGRQLADDEIKRYAGLAHAEEFISRLPQGYQTVIGERGAFLSGGQRQRLALARALAREPRLLILDEATSALDAESESHIQDALDAIAGTVTVLIVAHRLATVRRADRIYVLEGGGVVESGTWDALHALNGRFARLQTLQSI